MDINDLTIGQVKEISQMMTSNADNGHPYQIGKNYLIRTVTMIQFGTLVAVHPQELVLENAAWIADTGRFSDSLVSGEFGEVEPFPDGQIIVGRGAVIDAVAISAQPLRLKK